MNKPKIRFKGYTEDWEQSKLGDMMNVTSVKRIHQSDWTDSGIRFLRARDIVSAAKNEEPDDYLYISKEKYDEYSLVSGKVAIGDMLVTGVGTIGVPYLIRNSESLYFKDGNIIWFQNGSKIDGDFFFYSFLGKTIQDFINKSAGIGTVGTYTIESGKKTPITLPEMKEQQQIGVFFHHFDHLITLHQHKCDETKTLKKYMLQKMFPQDGANVPEIRFDGFTEAWEQRKLGEMSCSFEYGLNAAATTYDGENRYIRITDIDDETRLFLTTDLTSPDIDLKSAGNYRLQEGDIVFARTGASVGKTYIYKPSDGIMYYAGFLIRAKIRPEYSADFVFQNTLTERYRNFVAITSQRSGQPGINAQEYGTFEFSVPGYKEQEQIGAFFRNLDHLIALHQRKLEKLQNIKKSMLEKMFI